MKIVENSSELLEHLGHLVAIADTYKTEIGFWPRRSLVDAIGRGRLIAVLRKVDGRETPIGFVVFGGVFPNGRIQAIAIDQAFLRIGVAQFLIDNVVAKMEAEGFLTVSAKPAKDLLVAQQFYQKNQFFVVRSQPGGASRNREIVVRERVLKSPSLLTEIEMQKPNPVRPQPDIYSKLWVIDKNVLFDLVKTGRSQYEMATGIFSAALDGRVSVAVTSEFSSELGRAAASEQVDPLLMLANALPRLRITADDSIKNMANEIHQLLFVLRKPSQAGTPQAQSDCTHLAECVAGNAAAFVTSDGVLLRNRRLIRETWGLEVVALEDFHDALASTVLLDDFKPARGTGFRICKVDAKTAQGIAETLQPIGLDCSYFREHSTRASGHFIAAIDDGGAAIGILATAAPDTLGTAHRMLLLLDHEKPNAELFADMLLSYEIDAIGKAGLSLIDLAALPGQIVARKAALQIGFVADESSQTLSKAALGSPITPASFPVLSDRARIAFGGGLSDLLPTSFDDFDTLLASDRAEFQRTEDLLAPTLIVSNNRRVSIQPIGRTYADELLGTSAQTNLLNQFEGAFRSKKIYVSSGRSRNFFKTNQLILFYESSRTGGRGAVVAAARVNNVVTQRKKETGKSEMKRTVLDSVDRFSASEEVTLTSFSSLLRFPRPVRLNELKELNAVGTQNLRTATVIATAAAQAIFDRGWNIGR